MRIVNFCVVYEDSILQTGVCANLSSGTLYARLLVFDKTAAQPDFAVCSGAVMNVFYSPAQPVIFAVMNYCVVALSLFSSDILTWSADSLYSVQ